jgi:hypothetical protein
MIVRQFDPAQQKWVVGQVRSAEGKAAVGVLSN